METFSIGFGRKIAGFHKNGTDYRIALIPLGGYVKMAGENPEDPRSGQPDEFLSKSKWQRFQILIMGPAMNLGLAVVVLAVVLMQGATSPACRHRARQDRTGKFCKIWPYPWVKTGTMRRRRKSGKKSDRLPPFLTAFPIAG